MYRLMMEAPAEVPAMTAPRSWARMIASPTGVPTMFCDSLTWLPPLMKTPVAASSASTISGSLASRRVTGSTTVTSPPRSRVKTSR